MPTPSDSTIEAMVEAVPMVMQWPCERCMHDSASWNSSKVILPARRSSDIDQTLVPEPISVPRYLPDSIGPPDTRMVGRSTLAAPISVAHVLGKHAEVRVARRELGPRVADADDRPAVELVLRHAAVLHPAAVDEPV